MLTDQKIKKTYEELGGQFILPIEQLSDKLTSVRGFLFDWDGVFNDGKKSNEKGSPFSEADSMGLNMLKFGFWLKYGKLPYTAIITGENNLKAIDFAKREHMDQVFLNAKDKLQVLEKLEKQSSIQRKETLFVFDDILDLSLANACSLRMAVKRAASPLFEKYIKEDKYCDYISAHEGGRHAVREISELLLGLYGNFDEVVSKRIRYKGDYESYLSERELINTQIEQ